MEVWKTKNLESGNPVVTFWYFSTNWLNFRSILKNGKIWHPRNVSENLSLSGKVIKPSDCEKVWKSGKHRYLMPLDDAMRKQIQSLAKPYPKRVTSADSGTLGNPAEKGRCDSDRNAFETQWQSDRLDYGSEHWQSDGRYPKRCGAW